MRRTVEIGALLILELGIICINLLGFFEEAPHLGVTPISAHCRGWGIMVLVHSRPQWWVVLLVKSWAT